MNQIKIEGFAKQNHKVKAEIEANPERELSLDELENINGGTQQTGHSDSNTQTYDEGSYKRLDDTTPPVIEKV